MIPYVHLHVHSQYSILDGAASIKALVNKAVSDGMPALALTDHGTMYGIKEFHEACKKANIKPIIGCETYIVDEQNTKDRANNHLILLAKNDKGYRNLLKLVSEANLNGFYYRPRIDKRLLEKHCEGLIATTACIGGEIPKAIRNGNMEKAEEDILWYKKLFGSDFYLEVQRHPAENIHLRTEVYEKQLFVAEAYKLLSQKLDVKIIATNDVHFTNPEDADAHDLLICLNTGKDIDDPTRMRYTKHEWFKTQEEMNQIFHDFPEALANVGEIVDKVETYQLNSDPIMPEFPIPESFGTMAEYASRYTDEALRKEFTDKGFERLGGYEKVLRIKFEADYLAHLTFIGAKKRYGEVIPEEYIQRLEFELETMKTMGFPGYFLIVQDFIQEARNMGVLVGPGRGSAAGAVVAYCLGITNIDPIKYDLLFERFLNPDRISMPDIDIDFDDDGRQMVLNYVTNKYGKDRVAHICTFGTMAAKSAIKDVARVLKLPLSEADRLSKMVPETPKITLAKAFKENPELELEKGSNNPLIAQTLRFAATLEGSVRQTGVHACGVLIGRDPLVGHIPLLPTKDEDIMTTQYDGRFVESIGLLKMDFLGLKTLSIIKETLDNIKRSRNITVDIDTIPIDDALTYELFSRGDTTAIFQFESDGMKKHLKALKPNRFEDLVAMNALYRPGPMEYIPKYVARKHGSEVVEYDHPLMEKYLNDTYGITVYQEQVMLLSRLLGNFTRGESDTLRKAMGKKQLDMMAKLSKQFKEGCLANPEFMAGCEGLSKKPEELIDKIWKDWEAFASYAFNKSHSVCYAYLAYQTGYLKAHYPAEFMAGVLSCNLSDITKIGNFMDECKRMALDVKGPDVNESIGKFAVNKKGELRFGLTGIKGVGAGAVDDIVREREKNGLYADIFNFAERVNLQSVNKKNWEGLALSGAFDNLGIPNRSQYFAPMGKGDETTYIEAMLRYGTKIQADKALNSNSLFDMLGDMGIQIKKPEAPFCEPWSQLYQLNQEKALIGIYLSAHPLDQFSLELEQICNLQLVDLADLAEHSGRDLFVGGMITKVRTGTGKTGNPYGMFTLEDFSGAYEFPLFGKDFIDFKNFVQLGLQIMVKGSVQPKWRDSNEMAFKIKEIKLLSDVRAEMVQKLTISLDINFLDEEIAERLTGLVMSNPGKVLLNFEIFNSENDSVINLSSKTKRISLTNDFVTFFKSQPDIRYFVN